MASSSTGAPSASSAGFPVADLAVWSRWVTCTIRRTGDMQAHNLRARVRRVDGLQVGAPMSRATLHHHMGRPLSDAALDAVVEWEVRLSWTRHVVDAETGWYEWRVQCAPSRHG